MSVENKIKELLGKKQQLTEQDAVGPQAASGAPPAVPVKKDTSKAAQVATAGDPSMPKMGGSQDAEYDEMDEFEAGSKNSAMMKKDATLPTAKGDAKSVTTQATAESVEEGPAIKDQLDLIFGESLSEEFKTKATSIFEAAVIARVNHEMETVTKSLEESFAAQVEEFKETMVEKVDGYIAYIVEQWMNENQIAIDSGLRTEIAEDFIGGLKVLFKEHFIEVPEEKYDVIEELSAKAGKLEEKLNSSISENIELTQELSALKAQQVLEQETKTLARTDAEKLMKLVEGVEFDSEEVYREKVRVIKENYFPKAPKQSPDSLLIEENGEASFNGDQTMNKYVQALARTIKNR